MTLADALERVWKLAEDKAVTPEDQEAVDTFYDFMTNCPWLEEDEED